MRTVTKLTVISKAKHTITGPRMTSMGWGITNVCLHKDSNTFDDTEYK